MQMCLIWKMTVQIENQFIVGVVKNNRQTPEMSHNSLLTPVVNGKLEVKNCMLTVGPPVGDHGHVALKVHILVLLIYQVICLYFAACIYCRLDIK